jgi:hypothetical protein
MKPWDMVSSFWGANTLFQGQQIKRTDTNRRENIQRREKHKRDQRSDQRRRSRKIQAADPKKNQDCSETQRQRVITHCKKRL